MRLRFRRRPRFDVGALAGPRPYHFQSSENALQIQTFAGTQSRAQQARAALESAGLFVTGIPVYTGIQPAVGEAHLSIEGGDSDSVRIIEHLGWRHLATTGSSRRAVKVGGQG